MDDSEALRALPVAVTASCYVRDSLALCDGCHSFLLAYSATGGARKRPQAEPHLDISYHNIIAEGEGFVKWFAQKSDAAEASYAFCGVMGYSFALCTCKRRQKMI